ncbi:DUF3466 family protein [Dongshaea marina]|uniref:DUF3466 family protein n=1 Tax=Dongshaea marina TaxID=2047966 RepID=UPI00131F1626|nr:DUF3466 family protein [Dongshaea marina]
MRHAKKLVSTSVALALAVAAGNANAAIYYTITDISATAPSGANFGPYPQAISPDGSKYSGTFFASNPWLYFLSQASQFNSSDRFSFERGCWLDSGVCDARWEPSNVTPNAYAYVWRQGITGASDIYRYPFTSDNLTAASGNALVTAYSDETSPQTAGYTSSRPSNRSAEFNSTALMASFSPGGNSPYSQANALVNLGSNKYLVGGTYAFNYGGNPDGTTSASASYTNCYSGDTSKFNNSYGTSTDSVDLRYCPGYNTAAALWLVDNTTPSAVTQSLIGTDTASAGSSYIIKTASINGFNYDTGSSLVYAAGYIASSANDSDDNNGALDGRNKAAFWVFSSTSPSTKSPIPIGSDPTDDTGSSSNLRNSWAIGVTGEVSGSRYVVGNNQYQGSSNNNFPTQMFTAKVSSSAVVSQNNNPVSINSGEDLVANAVNPDGLVVGWRDSRETVNTQVINGSGRKPVAFMYNIQSGGSWYLNDLICTSSSDCSQHGKYYWITNASDVDDSGNILAEAKQYNSYDDWANDINYTTVMIKLTRTMTSDPSGSYVVRNVPAGSPDLNEGGGSFSWMLGLLLPLALWRRFGKAKK